MLISIRWSKTIQFQDRTLDIPIAKCPAISLCAVYWTLEHFTSVPADPDSLTFLIPNGDSYSPLDYDTYQKMLNYFGGKVGIDTSELSSHSLRWGGCTYLAMCGASLEEIKTTGDWASDVVFTYLKTPLTVRIINYLQVAAKLSGN